MSLSVSSEPLHYTWWFPGAPVRVHISLALIQRMQDRLGKLPAGHVEEGLLFGKPLDSATEILDFQPASERITPRIMVTTPDSKGGCPLVGYYRTEPSDTLRLNENDFDLARDALAKPYQVFLVIQSLSFGPPAAAFFFHDRDGAMSDFSLMEFPFDAQLLAAEAREKISRSLTRASNLAAANAGLGQSADTPRLPRFRNRVLRIVVWGLVAAIAGSIGIALTVSPWRQWSDRIFRPPAGQTSIVTAPVSAQLQAMALRATRQNRDLSLTWNRDSSLIATALSGVISIDDGSAHRQITLTADQMRNGSILYSPSTDQILIRLTAFNASTSFTESIVVLLPAGEPTKQYRVAAPHTSSPTRAEVLGSIPAVKPSRSFTVPNFASNSASLPMPDLQEPPAVAASINPGAGPAGMNRLLSAPPPLSTDVLVHDNSVLIPGGSTVPRSTDRTMPPDAKSAPPEPSAQPITYEPPAVISTFPPRLQAGLQALVTKPMLVEVRVTIGENGKVIHANPLSREPDALSRALEDAAVNAARFSRFRSARRNNQPITGELVIRFVFKPQHQP